jgi:hypothetical protein
MRSFKRLYESDATKARAVADECESFLRTKSLGRAALSRRGGGA